MVVISPFPFQERPKRSGPFGFRRRWDGITSDRMHARRQKPAEFFHFQQNKIK